MFIYEHHSVFYFYMDKRSLIILGLFLLGLSSCVNTCNCNGDKPAPETVAIHNPIYPDHNDPETPDIFNPVTFTLFLKNDAEIKEVKLSITKKVLNVVTLAWGASVAVTSFTWSEPVNFPLTFQYSTGFNKNELITYVFNVTPTNTSYAAYEHKVIFATRPYPFSMATDAANSQPAPIYITAHTDSACNVVFIPDVDLEELVTRTSVNWRYYFFNSIRDNILNGIFGDPSTKGYFRGYNFYINAVKGEVDPVNNLFDAPDNLANIEFTQGKSYMHNKEYVEFSNNSSLMKSFSNRIYNRGTFMHESGHVLYFLADEYEYGLHWQDATTPNNWRTYANAKSAAPSYGLSEEHICPLKEPTAIDSCYILCPYEGCQMGMCGLSIIYYCKPCKKAVERWMDIYTN
ncbi:MAG: hypothetical protein ACHQNT_00070 [Bacteroidia bacterium]